MWHRLDDSIPVKDGIVAENWACEPKIKVENNKFFARHTLKMASCKSETYQIGLEPRNYVPVTFGLDDEWDIIKKL